MPRYRSLITGVHTGPALDTILKLKVYHTRVIDRVALGWTYVRRATMWTGRITNVCIYKDVWRGFAPVLVTIRNTSKSFCNGCHRRRESDGRLQG
jgi:hypothetical protein